MTSFLWSQLQRLPDDVIRERILPYTYQSFIEVFDYNERKEYLSLTMSSRRAKEAKNDY
jgi:hypothetical protein